MASYDDLPIPGSIVLVDTDGHLNTLHSSDEKAKDIILSPVPSNDVNDPLNWTWGRKQVHFWMVMLYLTTCAISFTTMYSALVPLSEATGIDLSTIITGGGVTSLLAGWGGLITQPLAMIFGKRFVYLLATLVGTMCMIWTPFVKSGPEWYGIRVLYGCLSGSPAEMLCEYFAHERGNYISLYALVLFGSSYLAPVMGGFINDSMGWKAIFWFCAIQQGVAFIILFIFLEESNYNRGTSEKQDIHTVPVVSTIEAPEKSDVPPSTSPGLNTGKGDGVTDVPVLLSSTLQGRPYTQLQKMRLLDRVWATPAQAWQMVYRPILLLRFPGIFWAGFAYGAHAMWYTVLNSTASIIFSGPPYDFSAGLVGVTYIGPLLGTCVATVWSGWIGDRFSLMQARKKRGSREPEDRLWLLAITLILCPAGLILWGVGAANGINWFGLVFGGGVTACSTAVGSILTVNYAIDSYKDLSHEVLLGMILVRNTMLFAVSYGITPWLNLGYQNTFLTAAGVGFAINATFLLVILFGKKWRKASRVAYWSKPAELRAT